MEPSEASARHPVRRARRYVERLTGHVAPLLAIDDRADGSFQHLEVLVLVGVVVLRRKVALTAI
jgi:hypothetical protein